MECFNRLGVLGCTNGPVAMGVYLCGIQCFNVNIFKS